MTKHSAENERIKRRYFAYLIGYVAKIECQFEQGTCLVDML